MVLELKDKLFDESGPSVVTGSTESRSKYEEAVSALEALGFRKKDAEQAVREIISSDDDLSVSEVVKHALSRMKR